jgi:hypothetical protein
MMLQTPTRKYDLDREVQRTSYYSHQRLSADGENFVAVGMNNQSKKRRIVVEAEDGRVEDATNEIRILYLDRSIL